MAHIFRSRYTPGLENGENVFFEKGEVVTYQCRDGKRVQITIDCEDIMNNSGYLGYEAIFHDDNGRYFAIAKQIVDWEGKC